jgi:hypothetical protein
MLQYRTVEPGALDLLKKVMQLPALKDFYLVGGTALALIYGHRSSVDMDLFSITDFSNESIISAVENKFPGFTYKNAANPVGIFGFINDEGRFCQTSLFSDNKPAYCGRRNKIL